MIDVGVAQNDGVESIDSERKGLAVALVALAAALDHAAVQKHGPIPGLDPVTRSGDFPGGAVEGNSHADSRWLSSVDQDSGPIAGPGITAGGAPVIQVD